MSTYTYTKEQLLFIRGTMSQDIRNNKFLNIKEFIDYLSILSSDDTKENKINEKKTNENKIEENQTKTKNNKTKNRNRNRNKNNWSKRSKSDRSNSLNWRSKSNE